LLNCDAVMADGLQERAVTAATAAAVAMRPNASAELDDETDSTLGSSITSKSGKPGAAPAATTTTTTVAATAAAAPASSKTPKRTARTTDAATEASVQAQTSKQSTMTTSSSAPSFAPSGATTDSATSVGSAPVTTCASSSPISKADSAAPTSKAPKGKKSPASASSTASRTANGKDSTPNKAGKTDGTPAKSTSVAPSIVFTTEVGKGEGSAPGKAEKSDVTPRKSSAVAAAAATSVIAMPLPPPLLAVKAKAAGSSNSNGTTTATPTTSSSSENARATLSGGFAPHSTMQRQLSKEFKLSLPLRPQAAGEANGATHSAAAASGNALVAGSGSTPDGARIRTESLSLTSVLSASSLTGRLLPEDVEQVRALVMLSDVPGVVGILASRLRPRGSSRAKSILPLTERQAEVVDVLRQCLEGEAGEDFLLQALLCNAEMDKQDEFGDSGAVIKLSVEHVLLEALAHYCKSGKPLSHATLEAAVQALDMVAPRNVITLVEALHLADSVSGRDLIAEYAQGMLKQPQVDIATVALLVSKYDLIQQVDAQELIVAMLLMDIMPMKLAEMTANHARFQTSVLTMLEQLCAHSNEDKNILFEQLIKSLSQPLQSVVSNSKKRGRAQMWSSVGARLIRRFGLDPNSYKNIYRVKDDATAKFYFRERDGREAAFKLDGGRHPDHSLDNIDELLWLIGDEWPHVQAQLADRNIARPSSDPNATTLANWLHAWQPTSSPNRYFRVAHDAVVFVSRESEIAAANQAIAKCATVGISYQHRVASSFTLDQDARASVVQIATPSIVYIFDVDAFADNSVFVDFLSNLISAATPLKISYQIDTMPRYLELLSPAVAAAVAKMPNAVSLLRLYRTSYRKILPPMEVLFTELTAQILDNNEELSDWKRRPLRPAQLHYAAASAMAQLKMYELLKVVADQARSRLGSAQSSANSSPARTKTGAGSQGKASTAKRVAAATSASPSATTSATASAAGSVATTPSKQSRKNSQPNGSASTTPSKKL
jgi:hypothetical protein